MEEKMEVWKQTNYENYEVSSEGRVRSTKTGKFLKPIISRSNGYWKVTLSISGKSHPIELHRLLAGTFLNKPQSDERLVVDHINGDKLDNSLSNLQWITHGDNLRKAKKRSHQPRFTEVEKDQIRILYESGQYSLISLTEYCNNMFNRRTHRGTYTRIVRG